jgi:DNA polymerase V
MKKMTRGGAREGAGRPKGQGRYGEPTKIMRVPVSMMESVKDMMESKTKNFALPLYDMTVQAGSPSITDSDNYELYNLNEKFLINDPDNHFLVKVSGYSMKDAGILPNDLLLVNRKKEARDGDIIVASANNRAVVKRLSQKNGVTKLISDNDDYDNIEDQTLNLHPWGVVTKVIRDY